MAALGRRRRLDGGTRRRRRTRAAAPPRATRSTRPCRPPSSPRARSRAGPDARDAPSRSRGRGRNCTYGARSILLSSMRSAARNMSGYLSGLSSPSVTDRITTLCASPRSKAAGQTRLPTFSMKSRLRGATSSCASARLTIDASRWQPLPVFTWTAGAPVARMRSASNEVCWSPSTTATGVRPPHCSIVRTSSVVLPEPGLDTKFSANTPRSAKWRRFSAAMASFLASRSRSTSTMRCAAVPSACTAPSGPCA